MESTPTICSQAPYAMLIPKIDALIERVETYQTAKLQKDVNERKNRTPDFSLSDNAILQRCIMLIAYSKQAQSRLVDRLVESGIFDRMFETYDPATVAKLDSDQLLNDYWSQIGAIRQRSKIPAMIRCAEVFLAVQQEHSSFMKYLETRDLPTAIRSESDIGAFWKGFKAIQSDLERAEMPFFSRLTSLCHLLQFLGYDCAKPDSVVMSAAAKLGIAPSNLSDGNRRNVVIAMQVYCLCRIMHVPVLDLYLLIGGGQTGARECVEPRFYPWP